MKAFRVLSGCCLLLVLIIAFTYHTRWSRFATSGSESIIATLVTAVPALFIKKSGLGCGLSISLQPQENYCTKSLLRASHKHRIYRNQNPKLFYALQKSVKHTVYTQYKNFCCISQILTNAPIVIKNRRHKTLTFA